MTVLEVRQTSCDVLALEALRLYATQNEHIRRRSVDVEDALSR